MSQINNLSIKLAGVNILFTDVFRSYWEFASERQNIFFRRMRRSNNPTLTDNAILQTYKFTNSYRASDRVSQYLIKNVIYSGEESRDRADIFFRIMLFKLFNKIETWELIERELGPISLHTYNFKKFDRILSDAMATGTRIYSAAYIMPSAGRAFGGTLKHQTHLKLLEYMVSEGFPDRISKAHSMSEAFHLMSSAPSIGPFLAYQYVTDLNYSPLTAFSEMDFVMAGPGALDGISKCFVDGARLDPTAVITYMAEHQDEWFERLEIDFQSLWGRPLQLIDCQNLFCEISKYARAAFPDVPGISGRTRIKQKFSPTKQPLKPWYPPKWGVNERIDSAPLDLPQILGKSDTARAVQYTLL